MTKNLFLSLAVLSLLAPKVLLSQDDTIETLDSSSSTSNEDLTDGPQTLPAGEVPALETESIPKPSDDDITGFETLGSDADGDGKVPQSDLQKKTGVISEEDLLKPKNPKPVNSKVRSQKQTTETEIYIQDSSKYKLNDIYKNLQPI